MESALPGVVCSRRNQSTQPSRVPSTTPSTRSPAHSLSLRYRRAAVWSEIPVTSARVRKDARGSIVRIWMIWRSIVIQRDYFHADQPNGCRDPAQSG